MDEPDLFELVSIEGMTPAQLATVDQNFAFMDQLLDQLVQTTREHGGTCARPLYCQGPEYTRVAMGLGRPLMFALLGVAVQRLAGTRKAPGWVGQDPEEVRHREHG